MSRIVWVLVVLSALVGCSGSPQPCSKAARSTEPLSTQLGSTVGSTASFDSVPVAVVETPLTNGKFAVGNGVWLDAGRVLVSHHQVNEQTVKGAFLSNQLCNLSLLSEGGAEAGAAGDWVIVSPSSLPEAAPQTLETDFSTPLASGAQVFLVGGTCTTDGLGIERQIVTGRVVVAPSWIKPESLIQPTGTLLFFVNDGRSEPFAGFSGAPVVIEKDNKLVIIGIYSGYDWATCADGTIYLVQRVVRPKL